MKEKKRCTHVPYLLQVAFVHVSIRCFNVPASFAFSCSLCMRCFLIALCAVRAQSRRQYPVQFSTWNNTHSLVSVSSVLFNFFLSVLGEWLWNDASWMLVIQMPLNVCELGTTLPFLLRRLQYGGMGLNFTGVDTLLSSLCQAVKNEESCIT